MIRGGVSIFIPAYNAETTITGVVDRIPRQLWDSVNAVYLINDGSRDRTGWVIDEIAVKEPRCRAVQQMHNRGYGESVKQGLALCRVDGCAYAACLHADGQYPPESIGEFVAVMEAENIDLLQGSRIASGTALSGGMPRYKYTAGKLLTAVENLVFRLSMTDYHSGFLVYSRRMLDGIDFKRLSNSFDFDLEVIASARAAGLVVEELPIPTRYAGEKSYLNPVTYGLRVLGVLIRYRAGRYRGVFRRGASGQEGLPS
ncbi:MAG: glycosyltransferase family 2 protein [Chitinispirillaceae bacterium]|nr:glycosyltransferase family 2 protein [Chitinispirillaceae bacterium]